MFCPKCNAAFDIHFMPDGTLKSLLKCHNCRTEFRIKIGFRGEVKSSKEEKEEAIRRCRHATKDDRRQFDRSGLSKEKLNHLMDVLRDTFLKVEYPLEKTDETTGAVDYSEPADVAQQKEETQDIASENRLNTGSYISGYLVGFILGLILMLYNFMPVWFGLIFITGLLGVPLVFGTLRGRLKK